MVKEKQTNTLYADFEDHKKNYTNTDFGVLSISQIQFTIEYHTHLWKMRYNQTYGLDVMA